MANKDGSVRKTREWNKSSEGFHRNCSVSLSPSVYESARSFFSPEEIIEFILENGVSGLIAKVVSLKRDGGYVDPNNNSK